MFKKTLSFLLVLSMILTLVIPMTSFAEEGDIYSGEKLFYNLVQRGKKITPADLKVSAKIAKYLNENREDIKNNLELEDEEKNFLEQKEINNESIDKLAEVARKYIPNENEIKPELKGKYFLLDLYFDISDKDEKNEVPKYEDYKKDIDKMVDEVYEAMPKCFKDNLGKYANTKEEKVEFFLKFVNEFFNDKIGTGTYDVSEGEWTKVDLKVNDGQVQRANSILKKENGEDATQIKDFHKEILNKVLEEISNRINNKKIQDIDVDAVGKALYRADLIDEVTVGKSTGGSSNRPSIPVTPGKVIVPEDKNAPVVGLIDEDGIVVKNENEVTIIEVKEKKALATIEVINKKAKDRDAKLVVKAKDIKNLNLVVSIPGSVVLALEESDIDFEVITSEIEYYIPHDAVDVLDIKKNSKVQLKSKELEKDKAKELVKGIGETKDVIEVYLEVINGKNVKEIKNFNVPVVVKLNVKDLGNYDKLAVYYINEKDNTLEFVTGHIRDDKVVMKLNYFSKYIVVESTKTFEDVSNHWSKEYVDSMTAKNVIHGCSDGTFKPNKKLTRAEFAKMIISALNVDLVENNDNFKDVDVDAWYAGYVETAKSLGIVKGYGDGTFRPDAEIKRVEMAIMLSRVVDVEVIEEDVKELENIFKDRKDIQKWTEDDIARVVKADVMEGTNKKTFMPNETATRAEAAIAIYRLYVR